MDPDSIINRANQLNPNNWRFWKSRGLLGRPEDWMLFLGEMHIPGLSGLKNLFDVKEVIIFTKAAKVFAGTVETVGPSGTTIGKTMAFLGTFKGTLIIIALATAVAVYRNYKPPQKSLLEQAGAVCKTSGTFVAEKSVIAAKYSAEVAKNQGSNVVHYGAVAFNATKSGGKALLEKSVDASKFSAELAKNQGPNVWHYGIVVPFNATKSGLYYSVVGVRKAASTLGYYCGVTKEK